MIGWRVIEPPPGTTARLRQGWQAVGLMLAINVVVLAVNVRGDWNNYRRAQALSNLTRAEQVHAFTCGIAVGKAMAEHGGDMPGICIQYLKAAGAPTADIGGDDDGK